MTPTRPQEFRNGSRARRWVATRRFALGATLSCVVILLTGCSDPDYRSRLVIFGPDNPEGPTIDVRDIGSLENPVWSPTGNWLAAWGSDAEGTAVVIIDARDGSIVRRVAQTNLPSSPSLAWSPDSKSLATVYLDPATRRSAVVVVVDTETWEARDVASFVSTSSVTAAAPEVAWSRDGKTIAVTAGVGSGSSDVAFIDAAHFDIVGPVDLPGYQFALTWLNDSTLAFGSVINDGIEIQTLDSHSGTPATLAAGFNTFAVAAASPDSTMIGVVSRIGTPSGLSLYGISADTAAITTLAPVVSGLVLSWAPGSSAVAVPVDGAVTIVPADGTSETRSVFKVGGKEEIRGLAWSPDGLRIAVSVRQRPPSD